jgi:hypothetical protein
MRSPRTQEIVHRANTNRTSSIVGRTLVPSFRTASAGEMLGGRRSVGTKGGALLESWLSVVMGLVGGK